MKNDEKIKVKKRNRRRRSKLFGNNKFVLVISVILSVIIWIIVSLSDTNEKEITVNDIKIRVPLSDAATESGLKVFRGNDQTASVRVTGNRIAVGSVGADDIVITAQNAGSITTSGNYPLSLVARKADSSDNFEISSPVTPSVITVFVDYEKEATFEIKNKIKYSVADGYHATVSLSSSSVTVSGPQSEVNKISYVCIKDTLKDTLDSDYSSYYDLLMYNEAGEEITSDMLTLSEESVLASISVNPEKKLPVKLNAVNFPDNFDYSSYVSLSVDSIDVSGPEDIMESTDVIYTEEVDLTSLDNNRKKIRLKLNIPAGCDNLSEVDTVEATFNFSEFKKKKFKLNLNDNRIVYKNLDDEYNCSVTTDSLTVTMIGPEDEIDALSSSDLKCVIDMSDIEGNTGSLQHMASVSVDDGFNNCWANGKYTVNIVVGNNDS